jgi:hypothetical protein
MNRKLQTAVLVLLAFWTTASYGQDRRHVSIRSTYLPLPIEGYHRIALVADLEDSEGEGVVELDPNECHLNYFGDPDVCTEIAITERTVRPLRTRTDDPLGLHRSLWALGDTPLSGTLFLVVPEGEDDSYRFVYESRGGQRTVIATEPLVYRSEEPQRTDNHNRCAPLARTVDDVQVRTDLRPGFVNDTYFLIMEGRKPHLNTWVDLKPVRYPRRPRYWRIDVVECRSGDIVLPAIGPYMITSEVSETMGTRGIELHWADGEVQRIDKP